MHPFAFLLLAACLPYVHSTPIAGTQSVLQVPLEDLTVAHPHSAASRQLHGRFLHITGGVFLILSVLYDADRI